MAREFERNAARLQCLVGEADRKRDETGPRRARCESESRSSQVIVSQKLLCCSVRKEGDMDQRKDNNAGRK